MAVCLLSAGLAVCCLPITTELLARATSGSANASTPFTTDELVQAATATREYTVGNHDLVELFDTIVAINRNHASSGVVQGALASLSDEQLAAIRQAINEAQNNPEMLHQALNQLQRYLPDLDTRLLDAEALSHLDDVHQVISNANIFQLAVWGALTLCLLLMGLLAGKRWVGRILTGGGWIIIIGLIALAVWAFINFNGFFAAFHSLFFADGSWTFPSDSLLITMYPINFWIGMGAVWLVTTLVLSVICVFIGAKLRK